jgi:hypothetical protein
MQGLFAALGLPESSIQPYGFWAAGEVPNPDPSPEAVVAAHSGADLVVAKSFGTLVAMLARRDHGLAPRTWVFLATPIRRFEVQGWLPLLEAHCAAAPTLFVQQTHDFNGPHADLAKLVAPYPLCRIVEIPGGDHLYEDIDAVLPPVRDWLPAA